MGQAKILIIDDDPDIVEAMKIVLENGGYAVDTASDGDEGMQHIKNNTPDLIILDVMMNTPQEGFVLSRELKHDSEYKDVPILMLTSVKDKTGLNFKTAAGDDTWLPVEEFLDKPVKPDHLLAKVQELLQK